MIHKFVYKCVFRLFNYTYTMATNENCCMKWYLARMYSTTDSGCRKHPTKSPNRKKNKQSSRFRNESMFPSTTLAPLYALSHRFAHVILCNLKKYTPHTTPHDLMLCLRRRALHVIRNIPSQVVLRVCVCVAHSVVNMASTRNRNC